MASTDPTECDQRSNATLIDTSPVRPCGLGGLDLNDCIDMTDWEDMMDSRDAVPDAPNEQDQLLTPAEKILDLVGPAVLLNIRTRTKAPTKMAWQKMVLSEITPEYLAGLTNNIGVSLGAASGGLFTIDCDDMERFQEMLALNPRFEGTLQSHGARGGNFWLRIEGDAPKSGELKDGGGEHVGEWRGNGNQTVLHGIHPSGIHYHHNDTPVITMLFSEIVWPTSWSLPWVDRAEESVRPAATTTRNQAIKGSSTPLKVVEVMLNSIPTRPGRDAWLKISAAVRNSVGDNATAIELLKAWSPEEVTGEYEQLLSSSPFDEITYGTLFYHAEQNGFCAVTSMFYYNGKTFFMQGEREFIPLGSESAVKQHILKLGVPATHHNDLLCYIREYQYMHHIGPLAGHPSGLHRFQSTRVLVTSGPQIIEGKEGDGSFLHQFFNDLLGDEANPTQLPCFLNWLAHCRRAVIRGCRTQSPATAFAGAKGDGKSLAIAIINKCLGGRSAKAYRFLSGGTQFNGELAGVELLTVDDDASSKDHRSRVHLSQSIKANLFAAGVSIEGKNRDAITLDPVQTIVFAVNDDPEHLRVLPELDENMMDKILLLKSKPAVLPDALGGREELISAAVDAALPGFLFELDRRDLSGAYDERGRLRCFWHPEIVQAIGLLSSEQQLREMVYQLDEVKAEIAQGGNWVGTAATLQGLLTSPGCIHYQAAKSLLSWSGACGTFMGRLSRTEGSGITRGGEDGNNIQLYNIQTPGCQNQPVVDGGVGG